MACIFCAIADRQAPASMVHQDAQLAAFMDIHPLRAGHTLVVPRRHAATLGALAADEVAALFGLAARIAAGLRASSIACDDVNIALNDGPAANQTVPHAHVHVIPRVGGDTPRLFARLLRRPLQPLFGATPRAELERCAAALRAGLATSAAQSA